MLVKSHSIALFDDFGLKNGKSVHFYEEGIIKISNSLKLSPVVRINALWVHKRVAVKCEVADTPTKKRVGLQNKVSLDSHCGLFFPYPGRSEVNFHQGSVPFPLDILFLENNMVVQMEENTKIGSKERWNCKSCDVVIEVIGGFCKAHDVCKGDKISYFAISKQDEIELKKEKQAELSMMAALSEIS